MEEELLRIVREIRTQRSSKSFDEIVQRHEEMYSRFPRLIRYAIEIDDFDENVLVYMLNSLNAAKENKLETDMRVSSVLADKYIYNEQNRPSAETIERSRERLRNMVNR